jgi:hypothetical protein
MRTSWYVLQQCSCSCASLHEHNILMRNLDVHVHVCRCKPEALGAIMADHTQLDWRPVLPLLKLPCLNLVGGCR